MQPKGDKGYDNNRARKDNTSNAKQTQPQNPKIPFNIDLPRNTLDHIGPKAGQGMNVGQYSNNQKRGITKLMSLQRNINISGKQGGFSDWSNLSEAPFESAQERRQVLMCVRIDEDSQRIVRTARQSRDIADKRIMYDHIGLHEETRKLHHRFLINNIANNYEDQISLYGRVLTQHSYMRKTINRTHVCLNMVDMIRQLLYCLDHLYIK